MPEMEKPFADYEWDDDYPGTFKPGKRKEGMDLDEVRPTRVDSKNLDNRLSFLLRGHLRTVVSHLLRGGWSAALVTVLPWDPQPCRSRGSPRMPQVLEMWKDKENPACMELPQDQLWQVTHFGGAAEKDRRLGVLSGVWYSSLRLVVLVHFSAC